MKIGAKLFVSLQFLFICIQLSINERTEEDGVCYFPGSNLNTILEEENLTFPVPINTLANYKCFYEDVTMHGNSSVQCLENGNWSGELPSCGYSTSICRRSSLIDKVIVIDGECIYFPVQERLNFTEANKKCKREVDGEIFRGEEEKLLSLREFTNKKIHYNWIQTHEPVNNHGNVNAQTERPLWQNCSMTQKDCCFALTNSMDDSLQYRNCSKTNSWICRSDPTGCGYPDSKPITLMIITKWENDRTPLKVKYTCPEGLSLEGDENRECRHNGSWSGEAPSCINITGNSKDTFPGNKSKETTMFLDDPAEEMEHKFNVYIITGIGTLAAVLLIVIGILLYRRRRKIETDRINNIAPAEITSFDSETLVSTEELYEEIVLDRMIDFKLDDDGYVSTDELKKNEGEYASVNSDKIKKTLALPTLNEERHSHLEYQNDFEMSNLSGATGPKENHFIIVENDLYKSSDDSDTTI